MSRKLYRIADFQSACRLEHLHIHVLANHFDDLRHQARFTHADIADFVLRYRSINHHRYEVRDDTFYFSCCHILL